MGGILKVKRLELKLTKEIRIKGIKGFFEKNVSKFGTGAKIDCPKEYMDKKVYVIIIDDEKKRINKRKYAAEGKSKTVRK